MPRRRDPSRLYVPPGGRLKVEELAVLASEFDAMSEEAGETYTGLAGDPFDGAGWPLCCARPSLKVVKVPRHSAPRDKCARGSVEARSILRPPGSRGATGGTVPVRQGWQHDAP
jgi:hypothetical protein